jgi:hypothetical protein
MKKSSLIMAGAIALGSVTTGAEAAWYGLSAEEVRVYKTPDYKACKIEESKKGNYCRSEFCMSTEIEKCIARKEGEREARQTLDRFIKEAGVSNETFTNTYVWFVENGNITPVREIMYKELERVLVGKHGQTYEYLDEYMEKTMKSLEGYKVQYPGTNYSVIKRVVAFMKNICDEAEMVATKEKRTTITEKLCRGDTDCVKYANDSTINQFADRVKVDLFEKQVANGGRTFSHVSSLVNNIIGDLKDTDLAKDKLVSLQLVNRKHLGTTIEKRLGEYRARMDEKSTFGGK